MNFLPVAEWWPHTNISRQQHCFQLFLKFFVDFCGPRNSTLKPVPSWVQVFDSPARSRSFQLPLPLSPPLSAQLALVLLTLPSGNAATGAWRHRLPVACLGAGALVVLDGDFRLTETESLF